MIQAIQETDPHPRRWSPEEYEKLAELGLFAGQEVELRDGEILLYHPTADRVEAQPRCWSKEEYYRLGDLGFFMGQKAELITGTILVAGPQKPRHYAAVDRVGRVLDKVLGPSCWVRTQAPLDLGLVIEPDPDVSVVAGHRNDYSAHPTAALLIVEVSDSTLAFDRRSKACLYAAGGIADYWIVNIRDNQLEVFRDPVTDPSQPHGHTYNNSFVLTGADNVTPLAFPGVTIPVADLLP